MKNTPLQSGISTISQAPIVLSTINPTFAFADGDLDNIVVEDPNLAQLDDGPAPDFESLRTDSAKRIAEKSHGGSPPAVEEPEKPTEPEVKSDEPAKVDEPVKTEEPAKTEEPEKPKVEEPPKVEEKEEFPVPEWMGRSSRDSFKKITHVLAERTKRLQDAQKRVEELTAAQTTGTSKELDEARARIAELEEVVEVHEFERAPSFVRKYNEPVKAAKTELLKFLVENDKILLDPDAAEDAANLPEDELMERLDEWTAAVNAKSPLVARSMIEMVEKLSGARTARDSAASGLRGKADERAAIKKEAEMAEANEWGGSAKKVAFSIAKDYKWGAKQAIPAAATKAQREAIEKENARIDAEMVPMVTKSIQELYARNPEATIRTVFDAANSKYVAQELESVRADRDSLQARVDELEGIISSGRKASEVKSDKLDNKHQTKPVLQMSAEEAVANFRNGGK